MKRRKLNRKTLPKWTQVLSAGQIWHLKDLGMLRLSSVAAQHEFDKEGACWECRRIYDTLVEAGVKL